MIASGVILNAKTLEIREYTIIGNDPIPTMVLDAAHALAFEKNGVAFDASLSLPVPPSGGKIVFRDLKPLSYPSELDRKGKTLKESSRKIGVSVKADLLKEKESGQTSIRLVYEHTTQRGNCVYTLPNGELFYQPAFSISRIETTIQLYPNQWVILGGLKTAEGETKKLALKLVE